MASYTLQGFTNDASSADLDGTNLNEMDNAIKKGHDFADSASVTPSAGKAMVWPDNGLLYKDFIITSPTAGGIASLPHGLTTTKVRSIDATLVNASGATIPRGYLNADGTRTAKFEINLNSTNVYVLSDSTLEATWVGQPVYIRIGYTV